MSQPDIEVGMEGGSDGRGGNRVDSSSGEVADVAVTEKAAAVSATAALKEIEVADISMRNGMDQSCRSGGQTPAVGHVSSTVASTTASAQSDVSAKINTFDEAGTEVQDFDMFEELNTT